MIDRTLRARVLLDEAHRLGLNLRDLIADGGDLDDRIPTLAAFTDTIAPTFTPATVATYRPYWRHLHDVDLEDLAAVVDAAVQRAQRSRPGSTGRASKKTCVAALRALFARAVAAGLGHRQPSRRAVQAWRARSRRRALGDDGLAELIDAVRTTTRDPDLDLLLVRFHLESGARRQGALDLRCRDLDQRRATVWLREKGDTGRDQPASPTRRMPHGRARTDGDRHVAGREISVGVRRNGELWRLGRRGRARRRRGWQNHRRDGQRLHAALPGQLPRRRATRVDAHARP